MVLIDKLSRNKVYRYILNEGVIVVKKDFSLTPHKQTEIPNLHVWMLLRSLKDRDYVELVFNWQYYYYFLKAEGKKFLNEYFGLTENVEPITWKAEEGREYEVREDNIKSRGPRVPRGDRPPRDGDRPQGGRGGPRRPREQGAQGAETPAPQAPAATAN